MNCKPGDLAIIIASKMASRDIGKLVRVISFHIGVFYTPDGHPWDAEDGGWMVEGAGSPLWDGTKMAWRKYVCYDDTRLRPIRPPASELPTEAARELEA